MALLNQLLETCATLTKKVGDLEQDKIAQAIEITKLQKRVRRLEKKRKLKASGFKRLRKVYHLDLEYAQKVLSMQDTDEAEPAKLKEVLEVVTAAKMMTKLVTTATTINATQVPKASALRRRKNVVIRDPEETATPSVIVHSVAKSKDKGKGNLVEEPKPLKRQAQIEQDEAYAIELKAELNDNINLNEVMEQVKRKEKQDNTIMRYQALKRKPISENEIEEEGSKRKSESLEQKAAKKEKIDDEVEEPKTHLQIVVDEDNDVFNEATPLATKVPVVDYQIHTKHNKPFYKIIKVYGTNNLFLSFITLLRNFDREDLEMLWKIVQERFESSEPKNFSDDFLLNALKTMFEKFNVEANIWRNQRGGYGLAKVKS
nr:hypothetical protein [Tanacetum cinerariifolium]